MSDAATTGVGGAPRPGFRSGFVPTFSRALRTALPGKKAIIVALALSVPPLIALSFGATGPHEWRRARAFYFLVTFLDLSLLVPLCGLLFGCLVGHVGSPVSVTNPTYAGRIARATAGSGQTVTRMDAREPIARRGPRPPCVIGDADRCGRGGRLAARGLVL